MSRTARVGGAVATAIAIAAMTAAGAFSFGASEPRHDDNHSDIATCSRLIGVSRPSAVIVLLGPCPAAVPEDQASESPRPATWVTLDETNEEWQQFSMVSKFLRQSMLWTAMSKMPRVPVQMAGGHPER